MPSWCMPASWANAFAPTTALLGGTEIPVMVVSIRLVGYNFSSCSRVLTAYLFWRTCNATASSSSEALPARSPLAEHFRVIVRRGVAHRVRQIDDIRPRFHGG